MLSPTIEASTRAEVPPAVLVVAARWWLVLRHLWHRLTAVLIWLVPHRTPIPIAVICGDRAASRRLERSLARRLVALLAARGSRPALPIGILVSRQAATPGGDDLGWVRAAFQVADGPTGRRATIWLAAVPAGPPSTGDAQRVEDWLTDGLAWALFRLMTWTDGDARVGVLPLAPVPAPPAAPPAVDQAPCGMPAPPVAAMGARRLPDQSGATQAPTARPAGEPVAPAAPEYAIDVAAPAVHAGPADERSPRQPTGSAQPPADGLTWPEEPEAAEE